MCRTRMIYILAEPNIYVQNTHAAVHAHEENNKKKRSKKQYTGEDEVTS